MRKLLNILTLAMALGALAFVTPAKACTPDEAAAAALSLYPGGVVTSAPELEDEDGAMIYGIHVKAADGKLWDVKVDFTTCTVLRSDPDDAGDGGPDGGGDG